MFETLKAQAVTGIQSTLGSLPDNGLGLHNWLLSAFGLPTTVAIYLAAGALAVLVLLRIVKLSFDIVKWVVIPATLVALLVAWLLPVTFSHALPVAAALFSGVLLFKS
jgi:hypothetical protein